MACRSRLEIIGWRRGADALCLEFEPAPVGVQVFVGPEDDAAGFYSSLLLEYG
jgi:hypothetical protein